jgi:ABC-type branched-subunit amino acid transport system ATPase component/ABC-type branched-subunit amino acid transport system permease subunit
VSNVILFLILGLGSGAIFASLALSLVLVYRSSGVVNFAAGAIAVYAAFTYAYLRGGELLDPIPGLPATVRLNGGMGFFPAALIALAMVALLGCVLYVAVFRFLRNSVPVAKLVASIGVMITIQAVLALKLGTNPLTVGSIFPQFSIRFAGANIPGDRLLLAAAVVVITLVVAAVYGHTRFGLATQAVAESEKGAIVTGLSPDKIALTNWAISCAVAGLAGILVAPLVPLAPAQYTLFIVPALAAWIAGSYTGITVAVLVGIAIGMFESLLTFYQTKYSWFPQSGMAELIPLLVIIVFLLIRGRALPERGLLVRKSLGLAPRPRHIWISAFVATSLGLVALLALSEGYRAALVTSFILSIITLSSVVVTGYAGQVSLAQLVIAGIGGFAVTGLTWSLGVPFPLAPLLAGGIACVIGVVVGAPALRLRGLSVAAVTLALAVFIEAFWFENNDFNGGSVGTQVRAPSFLGIDLRPGAGLAYPRLGFSIMCLIALALVAIGVAKLRTTRLGQSMLAVRANERSAAAVGIHVAKVKIQAFALASFIAGVGGALLAYQLEPISYSTFDALVGLSLFATVYLAGVTSVSGGILAGLIAAGGILNVWMELKLNLGGWYNIILGVLMIITIIRDPEGVMGRVHAWLDRRRKRSGHIARTPQGTDSHLDSSAIIRALSQPDTDARGQGPGPGLSVRGINVSYGGFVALDSVDIDVNEGEIAGLIGPNGAGKTTLIDSVSGFAKSSGTIEFGGARIEKLKPHQRAGLGLVRTFQSVELYDDLTVRENLVIAQTGTRSGRRFGRNARRQDAETLDSLLGLIQLTAYSEMTVRELSHGQRQLLSVARALATRPKIVLLDEPAAGLGPSDSEWLGHRLLEIARTGVGVLLVDHDMSFMLGTCHRMYVLNFGHIIATGTPEAVRKNPDVIAAYLGSPTTADSIEITPVAQEV